MKWRPNKEQQLVLDVLVESMTFAQVAHHTGLEGDDVKRILYNLRRRHAVISRLIPYRRENGYELTHYGRRLVR